ncbi:MAG: hypothetical protein OER95_06375 [Acidimicrobiia bacterium]|nr:hypothetical protein [Acidimicrobiia bacterium]
MPHCAAGVVCENPNDHGSAEQTGNGAGGGGTVEEGVDTGGTGIGFTIIGDAEESAIVAMDSLAERIEAVGEPVELDAFGIEASMNAFAAALVAVGMSVALIVVGIRNWKRGWTIPARYLRFTLVSLFGVGAGLGLWELVSSLSSELAVIPDEVTIEGDLWSGPFASLTLPAIEVMLDAQPWVVGLLIVALPLAAAISMFGPYDRLIYAVIALVVANIIWLPFVVILTSRLLLNTNAAHIGWWSMAACLVVIGANGLAVAGLTGGNITNGRQ